MPNSGRTLYALRPAADDRFRVALVAVDVQNTFCLPDFELYVGGRSGTGALDDNRRLVEFVYRNLGIITQIFPTLDTHQAAQIFHALFFVNEAGKHPDPMTTITVEDVETGKWRFNESLGPSLGLDAAYAQDHLRYYTRTLAEQRPLCAHRVALPRHAGKHRPCARARI